MKNLLLTKKGMIILIILFFLLFFLFYKNNFKQRYNILPPENAFIKNFQAINNRTEKKFFNLETNKDFFAFNKNTSKKDQAIIFWINFHRLPSNSGYFQILNKESLDKKNKIELIIDKDTSGIRPVIRIWSENLKKDYLFSNIKLKNNSWNLISLIISKNSYLNLKYLSVLPKNSLEIINLGTHKIDKTNIPNFSEINLANNDSELKLGSLGKGLFKGKISNYLVIEEKEMLSNNSIDSIIRTLAQFPSGNKDFKVSTPK